MVHLTKIYTKTGDKGGTSLANGMRVNKISPLMMAIGDVDEANSAIGLMSEYSNPIIDMKYEKIMNSHKNMKDNKFFSSTIDNNNLYFSPTATYNDKCINLIYI